MYVCLFVCLFVSLVLQTIQCIWCICKYICIYISVYVYIIYTYICTYIYILEICNPTQSFPIFFSSEIPTYLRERTNDLGHRNLVQAPCSIQVHRGNGARAGPPVKTGRWCRVLLMFLRKPYPLVNEQFAMENYHFKWANQLL